MKKQYFYILPLMLCFGLFSVLWFTNPIKITNGATSTIPNEIKKIYLDELENQEKQIWDKLASFEISKKTFETASSKLHSEFEKIDCSPTTATVSKETEALIYKVCKEFGIEPQKITIVSYNMGGPIAASNKILFVNEKIFNTFSKQAQQFQIAHELRHILYHDTETGFVINNLFGLEERSKDPQHPANLYSCFREQRADIETALTSKEWAENYLTFTKEIMLWGESTDPAHPKSSERLKLAQNIVDQLNEIKTAQGDYIS